MKDFITPKPQHIAIIMDGNGRWAKSRNKARSFGHEAGAKRLKELIAECLELGVVELSVFAFSTENWARPRAEVEFIFSLLQRYLGDFASECLAQGVRFCAFGDLAALSCAKELQNAANLTRKCSKMRFNLGLNYGSLDEIARAAAALCAQGVRIDAASLFAALDIPRAVDLLIRTGGRARLSNFMLLQSAYAHIEFCDTFFPDFSADILRQIIEKYQQIPRTFGAVE